MMIRPFSTARSHLYSLATVAAAVGVFTADVYTRPEYVVSGLYLIVVLMAGGFIRGRALWLVSGGCSALTIVAQVLAHRLVLGNDQATYIGAFNTIVSVLSMALATILILRSQAVQTAINQARLDLAHVSRVTTMGELTASIAHEVNQPIAGVVTNASACLRWLAGDTPDLQEARAAATRIVRDGTRAADIISRIRLMFTKGQPQRLPTDINQLIRETVDLLGSQAVRDGATIQMDLAADVPQVTADRVQLQQVLLNLILNGIDAMKDVGGARELTVQSRLSRDGGATVSVRDHGVGLPSLQSDNIFNAFVTTKPHGTGMGLSISRSIVESHEGRLWAAPNEPRGATFAFSLPAGKMPVVDTASSPPT